MEAPYANDLRRRVLGAYACGRRTEEFSANFQVSPA